MFYSKNGFVSAVVACAALVGSTQAGAHEIKLGDLVIHHPWARQSPRAADVAAGFMIITNTGKDDDRLLKATASISPVVQLHAMKMVGDVMKMVELPEGILIPAGQTVELKPKSLHVMFTKLSSPVMEGEEIKGSLTFEKAGTVDITYEVTNPDAGMN